ncbi:hypothetical protein ACIBSW_31525 [Actinoplanes sp. NPDC049668]|uniref:hypothetical protein n=1 Tax=unclassified Actinoplanes TaxID=2626549 RepID=UPI0033BE46F2
MDRGPMALFGAIVAIGLGPAMWLGAQFGQVSQTPDRPASSVTVQENGTPRGGFGAGDSPTDTEVIDTGTDPGSKPRSTRTARPTPTSVSPSPSASVTSPTPPVRTSSPTPSKTAGDGDDPSTKPTTTAPTDPDVPPSSPTEVETQQVYVEASTA